ncbi:MAG TPA: carbamoyltransferase HypF [Dissulfurispiraceae bacterium]|nr:carbamoyltransferase HypF [Dissulfurispiraceae bacterium]
MSHLRLTIKGTVQGVGFRPSVYNLARKLGLNGFVTNTSEGVIVEVEGKAAPGFADILRENLPPLAKLQSIEIKELPPAGYSEFTIISSIDKGGFTYVSPDISICDDCLNEMLDPSDRRYQYSFINCTNCGPRYSITKKVPYDRPNTTMSVFQMCPLCKAEYSDPTDRRFHAQPNACPVCGPHVQFKNKDKGFKSDETDPIAAAIGLLKKGAIVAVKGLGGFHLCCDAENKDAVRLLRERKRRRNKPFAVMSPDIAMVRQFCEVTADEERMLSDRRRPIVLLKGRSGCLPDAVAPNNKYLGFMLPYTPLHYLLFNYRGASNDLGKPPHFRALVATSGNLSEEPIVIDNTEALDRLDSLADAFLFHNRGIFMRVDDSVVRVAEGKPLFIRRSRGYAPEATSLGNEGPDVLACGAEVKNTFTLTKGSAAIVSQHIGDMENLETLDFFEETLDNLRQVYRSEPVAVAYDLHPGYLSTQWAQRHIAAGNLKGYGIQHHHGHIASVMAEHGIRDKVIGVALDGTGYGTDGNLWGSEFMVCDLGGFERSAHFGYIPLPGGEAAIRAPWKMAVSYLKQSAKDGDLEKYLAEIGYVERYGMSKLDEVLKIVDNRHISPLTSGAGRLFDAVSALAGICFTSTYEGEAAIALESVLPDNYAISDAAAYRYRILNGIPAVIDFSGMVRDIAADVKNGVERGLISLRFHGTIVRVIVEVVMSIREKTGIGRVALSGGCFQNAMLLRETFVKLASFGFAVFTNENVPCNDACLSLGQAYILRHIIL